MQKNHIFMVRIEFNSRYTSGNIVLEEKLVVGFLENLRKNFVENYTTMNDYLKVKTTKIN